MLVSVILYMLPKFIMCHMVITQVVQNIYNHYTQIVNDVEVLYHKPT